MENIREIIEQNYAIKVLELEKIKNVYKIKTDDGYKCFKISRYGIEQFNFIVSAIQHLLNQGFEAVLPFVFTKEGDRFIKLNEGYGFLLDWIESREANFKNPVELKMCVDTLSRLHLASRGFNSGLGARGRRYFGKWIDKFQKRCDEILYFKAIIMNKDKFTEFDNIFLKNFDFNYKQGLKAIKDLKESNYFEIMERHKELCEFCHHDSANHNFLITPELNMYMIDFDYCILDSHLHDLASIIIRNLKHGNWNFETLEFIVAAYNENITIYDDELYLIYCFMEFPQDFWQVGLQYYVEHQPWDEEFFLRKLSRIVKDSKEKAEFLEKHEQSFVRQLLIT